MTQSPTTRETWVVYDGHGYPIYCASDSKMCHDHIGDMIEHDIDGAAECVVRAVVVQMPATDNADARCQPHGIAHLLPPLTLTAHQLRNALQLANPDGALAPDQLATQICLQHKLQVTDTDGEFAPAGLYCWLDEYPEEGSICVDAPWIFGPDDFNFHRHLWRQRFFSERTFGPGTRTKGVIDHIRKELHEIEENPLDVSEWIDVVILALDGAWRAGASPQQIIDALVAKQDKNERRQWPDWRTVAPDQAIEHVRWPHPEPGRIMSDAESQHHIRHLQQLGHDHAHAKAVTPAQHTVHCPNGPVHVCANHLHAVRGLQAFMGQHCSVTPAPAGAPCGNCLNEAHVGS